MRHATERTLLATIERRGWAVMDVRSTADLLSLAGSLGEVTPSHADGPMVDELRPKSASQAPPRSLSAQHGLGAFPYHTDAAHHSVPPRYMLLRLASENPPARGTLVASMPRRLALRDRQVLEHDVWLVDGGRERFLTSVLSHPDGRSREMIRFDEGCMRPADKTFGAARSVILQVLRNRTVRIEWVPSRTIVVDNWRTLHAREGATLEDGERILERVLVAQR